MNNNNLNARLNFVLSTEGTKFDLKVGYNDRYITKKVSLRKENIAYSILCNYMVSTYIVQGGMYQNNC